MDLTQSLFTIVPATFMYMTLKNKSTVITILGVSGGAVAGYITSNIFKTMKGD